MNEKEFIAKIKEILLIEEDINKESGVKIDSLSALMLIQFFDENFQYRLSSNTLNSIKKISDIVDLIKDRLQD